MCSKRASVVGTKLYSNFKRSCVIWPGRYNVLIWACGFFAMVALTAKGLLPIWDDYNNNNLNPQMIIKYKSEAPDVTICLPYYSTYLFTLLPQLRGLNESYWNGSRSIEDDWCGRCVAMDNAGYGFWRNMPHEQLESNTEVVKYLVQKFIEDNLYTVTLNETNFHWMQPMIDAVWYFFYWIYKTDQDFLVDEAFIKLHNSEVWADHRALDWLSRHDVDRLYDYILEVLSQCINGGCVRRQSTKYPPNNKTRRPLLIKKHLTILQDKFCFPATTEFGNEDFVCSYNRAYGSDNRPYIWDRFQNTSNFEIYDTPTILYAEIDDKDAVYSTPSWVDKSGHNESEHFFLTYNVASKLIAKRPNDSDDSCSNEEHKEVCIVQDQLRKMEECGGCVPFTLRNLQSNTSNASNATQPYCNSTHYSQCQNKIRENLNGVREKCMRKCEHTFYTWSKKQSINNEHNETQVEFPKFFIEFSSMNAPYTEFSHQWKYSKEQLVSQIGGVVNLYLGVSGLTFFSLLIIFIDQAKKWYWMKHGNATIIGMNTPREKVDPQQETTTVFEVWKLFRIVGVFNMLGKNAEKGRLDQNDRAKDNHQIDDHQNGDHQNHPKTDLSKNGDNQELQQRVAIIEQTLAGVCRQMQRLERVLDKINESVNGENVIITHM